MLLKFGSFLFYCLMGFFLIFAEENTFALDQKLKSELKENFLHPPMNCWPHTRWWWPGNPVTKEEITWELEQMSAHGIKGVEQISMSPVYEKGNIEFLSDEFLEMIKHTVNEAKRLGMEVSLNFGGPGWIIGGFWVPDSDRSKDMLPTSIDLVGPQIYSGPVPIRLTKTSRSWEIYQPYLSGDETLLAVVAGKIIDNKIDERTLMVLKTEVKGKNIEWEVPEGHWKLMAFWLAKNSHSNAVDHFSKGAMERYCNYLGGKFYQAVGDEFGKTLESFFCDSFELPNLASGVYWSNNLLTAFQNYKGYDLTKYLPAIWWEVSEISPHIRYDVNEFLHYVGLNTFFQTFLGWCEKHGINGRIQPYGFTTDNIEAAGMTHIPEMEITPGEKDAAPWFDTRIGPKKYVASGAHIYGRNVITVEAFTFIHWERYRTTLEELKIASDGFLRSGATKFYNHGYSYSPEHDIAPSRTMPWASLINPSNIWWKYYPLLAEYVARCAYVLRQGDFAPDIAIYSPLANQWTVDVLNPRKWTREFDWGELGFLLISNGYDFDLLNDDALQNIAQMDNGMIKIRNMVYKILILPNIKAIPLKTFKKIQNYIQNGGTVIALERIPEISTSFVEFQEQNKQVQAISAEIFHEPEGRDGVGTVKYHKGCTHYLKKVLDRKIWWDQRSAALDPFIKIIKQHILPDFGIDFAYEGLRRNEGLTFLHRKLKDIDIYFVTNIQDKISAIPVTFRVKNKSIWEWNPYNGQISPIYHYQEKEEGICVPLNLAPYQSTILFFEDASGMRYIEKTNFHKIVNLSDKAIEAQALENGIYQILLTNEKSQFRKTMMITDIPGPFLISGRWHLIFESYNFPAIEKDVSELISWTDCSDTKYFSGTARYEINFNLPENYIHDDFNLLLDLGKIGNIAEVYINDKKAGVIWMRGQTLDITSLVRAGLNQMTTLVTNTLINRISAFKEPNPVPAYLVSHYGSETGTYSDRSQLEFGFSPLPASGLMGPIKIQVIKNVKFVF